MTWKRCIARSLFTVVSFLIGSAMQAQFARVYVAAKTGNDSNSCNSIFTPCETFAGALVEVNAGGEIIVLESGGYGPVTIAKAVTFDAPTGVIAFIHPPSGDAITINAGAADTVILRGLTLNGGTNNGITVNSVGQLFVEHCSITGYANDGIDFAAPGGMLFMRDDDVRRCGHDGVLVTSSGAAANALVRDSYFANNTNAGLEAGGGSVVSVAVCSAGRNAGDGFLASTTSAANADLTLDHVQAVANGTGLSASASGGGTATLRFANSFVTQNTTGVSDGGGTGTLLGSAPGTSVVAGNGTNISGSLGTAMTLQ
jgi:hypothetical protein